MAGCLNLPNLPTGPGNEFSHLSVTLRDAGRQETAMHQIIYLVGLVVVIMFILSVLGLR